MALRTSFLFPLATALLAFGGTVRAEKPPRPEPRQWSTVKGQVVWAGGPVPKNPRVVGPPWAAGALIREDKLVIDPKTKGVRWVLVWLADPKDAGNVKFVPPIHPSLKNPPARVEIDSPGWAFEPRVLAMQPSQTLIVKNSGTRRHNILLTSIGGGPTVHEPVVPQGQIVVLGFIPKLIPTPYTCSIDKWMRGWIHTFAHPYFAVTDAQGNFAIKNAPVGKFQLVAWQEESGFILQKNRQMRGKVIQIEPGRVTDLGRIDLTLPKEDD